MFPPYCRVRLCGLLVNTDLNGLCGIVAPASLVQGPGVPGTLKVRLENGREVAAKPSNLNILEGRVHQDDSRELRLQQVTEQIHQEAAGGGQGRRAGAGAVTAETAASQASALLGLIP